MADIGSLRPSLLIHGHTTLTEQFTAEAVPGLEVALTQLRDEVLDAIRDGRTLPDILEQASLPAALRDHPRAVVPYLVIRDHFTERLYHQHTGYWQPDGTGLEPATAAEHAAALDLLAGGRDEQFAAGATPHQQRQSRPRPADHPARPAAPPRQHHPGRAAHHRAAPPHGGQPAVRPDQVSHLHRT